MNSMHFPISLAIWLPSLGQRPPTCHGSRPTPPKVNTECFFFVFRIFDFFRVFDVFVVVVVVAAVAVDGEIRCLCWLRFSMRVVPRRRLWTCQGRNPPARAGRKTHRLSQQRFFFTTHTLWLRPEPTVTANKIFRETRVNCWLQNIGFHIDGGAMFSKWIDVLSVMHHTLGAEVTRARASWKTRRTRLGAVGTKFRMHVYVILIVSEAWWRMGFGAFDGVGLGLSCYLRVSADWVLCATDCGCVRLSLWVRNVRGCEHTASRSCRPSKECRPNSYVGSTKTSGRTMTASETRRPGKAGRDVIGGVFEEKLNVVSGRRRKQSDHVAGSALRKDDAPFSAIYLVQARPDSWES